MKKMSNSQIIAPEDPRGERAIAAFRGKKSDLYNKRGALLLKLYEEKTSPDWNGFKVVKVPKFGPNIPMAKIKVLTFLDKTIYKWFSFISSKYRQYKARSRAIKVLMGS